MTVDEQIDLVLERLLPIADRIGELAAPSIKDDQRPIFSVLQVVRVFEDDGAKEQDSTNDQPESRQDRKLLGWHIDARTLGFLQLTYAELDIDEYGS